MYQPQFHVVLHQPQIPHNTGSVGRTCVAVAAKLWLVRPLGFRLDDYYLRRAGLDYWEHLVWEAVDDWPQTTEKLAGRRMWYFSKRGRRLHTEVEYARDDALVFGDEARGLPDSILDAHADQSVRIPIRSDVRSLNLSNAVAIALYEATRQVGFPGGE